MTAFQKQTPRDRKRLTRKLNRARDAWKAFLQEIDSVHERGNIHLAHLLRWRSVVLPGVDLRIERMLDNVTRSLDAVALPSEDLTIQQGGTQAEVARDLRDKTIRVLYTFFTEDCQLAQNDAEVRIAKIGNACWNWNLEYTERYDGITGWKGCDAVRKRIVRSKSPTDK